MTLEGDVQSEIEHQQALAIARSVDGVQHVQDQLRVAPATGTAASDGCRSTAAAIDDTRVTTKIQAKFFLDDLVKAGRVDVTTERGVVTLSGQVPSNEARQRAEALARQTEGVMRVQNQLTVGATAAASDLPRVAEP